MPTIQIPVYVADEDYVVYVNNKEELKEKTKEIFKKELKRCTKNDE